MAGETEKLNQRYTNTSGRDDNLNQTAAHDVALYDPDASDDHIVTMYETFEQAEAARQALAAIGIPEANLQVTHNRPEEFSAGVDYENEAQGLWSGLLAMVGLSPTHRHGYAEGVRRGHALLVVRPLPGQRQDAVRVLEASGPIDFDARLEEWRSAGWDNLAAQRTTAPAAGGPVHATVYDTATKTSQQVVLPSTGGTDPRGSHPGDLPTLTNTTGTTKG